MGAARDRVTRVDDEALSAMQRLASRTWTRSSRHHAGQLAWSVRSAGGASDAVRTWVEDGEVVGWGWAEAPGVLELAVDGGYLYATDVAREIVSWFLRSAPDGPTRTTLMVSDHLLLTVLREAGFEEEKAPWVTHHHFDLERLPMKLHLPDPAGYRTRAVEPGEAAPRAACHRAATGGTSPVSTSAYDALMGTAPYDSALDWVAVAGDGTWVASALAWLDEATGVALLEPVGVAPEHRRRGLATVLSLAALHAARDAGATEALVRPRGDQDDPGPQALFRGLGFEPGERTITLVRE